MEKSGQAKSSLLAAIIAVSLLVGLIYFFYSQIDLTEESTLVDETTTIVEPELPITIIEPVAPDHTSQLIVEQEAQQFISALAEKQSESIVLKEHEDQFIRYDSTIILPSIELRNTTLAQLLADPKLSADTPIKLEYTSEEKIATTLAQLSDQHEDHTIPITQVSSEGKTLTTPLFKLLEHPNVDLTAPITIVVEQSHSLNLKAADLFTLDEIDKAHTLMASITHGSQALKIKEIIQSEALSDGALFYTHRVSDADHQGLWGIVQTGLIHKFREGVHLEGIKSNTDTVQAIIPHDADEKLDSGLSSFLGTILTNKVKTSYIYNFTSHTMNHDPNKVFPGQQLILIHFSDHELERIYQFFSDKRNQGVEAFSVSY
jgi:hypothetical protein